MDERERQATKRVVVFGVDDTVDSERALRFVADNFLRVGDEVHLAHVVPDRLTRESLGADPSGRVIRSSVDLEEGTDRHHSYRRLKIGLARSMCARMFEPVLEGLPGLLHKVGNLARLPSPLSPELVA